MAELRATPMVNPVMGLLSDRLKKVQQFGAKPFGYENPPVEMLMNLLGVPAVQQTMERMAYGEPLTTGRGMTTKPRPEAVEAAMTLLPMAAGAAKATKGLPVGASIESVGKFNVTKRDASDIFGEGAQRIKYTDPKSGGSIDVLARPDGSASVLGLEVPEKFRGKGIGESLQKQVLQDFPDMQGQVSSKAAATNAYKLGRRPPNMPNATLDDVYRMIDEDSSVNMISPQMQQRIAPTPETGLLGQAAPALAPLTKGLPVGASIKNVGEELIYHGTSPKAAKAIEKSGFDVSKSADGTIWFTSNPNIGEVAATGKGAVVKRFLNEKKMKLGGWDETDKYSTDELIQKGFDGLKLVDDDTGEITYQIFNPEKLSVNKSYSYPQQEALDTAQRNAALPIEEGGLGLPKDNTPEMRAQAMGFDTPVYHATDVPEDFSTFIPSTRGKLGAGIYTSPSAKYTEKYVDDNARIMPLLTRGNYANEDVGAEIADKIRQEMYDINPNFAVQEWKARTSQELKNLGYAGKDVDKERVVFAPENLRSRFAAFDPMRKNEADILAGVLPLGLLADEEQRKKLYELMPSLLGQ